MEFFKYADDPVSQAKFSSLMPYGPTNAKANELIPQADLNNLPAGPNNARALAYSDAFWIENYDALKERWANWVIQ